MLRLNETLIYDKGNVENWANGLIKERYLRKVGQQPLTSVELSHIKQSSDVTTEALSEINTIDTAEKGLSKFSINFEGANFTSPIDEIVRE